ncbi:VOC family protein [Elioraea tepida]|uniref:VOC family protein n=1 Tax=Elioraea tepida TaxID=2843330 RepID=A0A975U3M9_9PROT|nr:VOC family protein [Elioraea tepida]QXM25694.1 VOC family protein [Elioraea tepida]
MAATSLDHVGIAGRDLGRLASAYESLGFRLTPRAQHQAPGPDGVVRPIGTGNRCAMLRRGYLELIAVIDPALPSNTLDRFLARYEGIHIVAFGIDDAEAELARLRAGGAAIGGIAWLERPVETREGVRTARFARLPSPEAPEGRMQLIRHLTPELLWQPHLLEHPNRAVSLDEVILAVSDPAEAAGRLGRLVGQDPVPVEDGFVLAVGSGRLAIHRVEGARRRLEGLALPCLPFIAGVVIGTDDGAQAIAAIAGARGRRVASGFLVPASEAGGATLLFT